MEPSPQRPEAPQIPAAARPEWHLRAVMLSVVLAACGYLGFSILSGWDDIVQACAKVGWTGILVALALSLVNYGLRFVRWQIYLRAMGHPQPWGISLLIYFAGFALTTTPAKAGEMLRGMFLQRRAVPYSTSFAAFLSERLSDLLAIVILTFFGLSAYPDAQPLIIIGSVGMMFALLVCSNPSMFERMCHTLQGTGRFTPLFQRWFQPWLQRLLHVLLQAQHCHRPLQLLQANTLSLLAWAAEAWAFYLILQWMGVESSLGFAVFVYALSMLAGALSFMPGGLGGAEAAMISLLMLQGASAAQAASATLIIRLTTLWFAVALGALALMAVKQGPSSALD